MINAFKETAVVEKGGRIVVWLPEIPAGTEVEVIAIIVPAEQDETSTNKSVIGDARRIG
jgi:hypothetical protein